MVVGGEIGVAMYWLDGWYLRWAICHLVPPVADVLRGTVVAESIGLVQRH